MKNTLLSLFVASGALLPFHLTEAAPIGKSYGGFSPAATFTFTVTKRISVRTKGLRVSKNAPVPHGIPDFHTGSQVQFTIGKKGQLTGPGFSLPFRAGKPQVNLYGSISKKEAATVTKDADKLPTGVTLTFHKVGFSGFRPVTNSVSYVLE